MIPVFFMDKENRDINSIKRIEDFELVFKEFFIPLSYYAMKFVKDMDASKEIVHAVFIKLWEKRNEIHSNVPLRSYLFTAVRNRSLNYLRDRAKFVHEDISNLNENQMEVADGDDEMEQSELEARIWKEINNLPERCAQVFKLARFENKKYREIAKIMGISVKTVEIQMSKALKILREKFLDIVNVIILWIIYFYFNFL